MDPATDPHRLEELIALLRQARCLTAGLPPQADDLNSLLCVAQIEAGRLYASTSGMVQPGGGAGSLRRIG